MTLCHKYFTLDHTIYNLGNKFWLNVINVWLNQQNGYDSNFETKKPFTRIPTYSKYTTNIQIVHNIINITPANKLLKKYPKFSNTIQIVHPLNSKAITVELKGNIFYESSTSVVE